MYHISSDCFKAASNARLLKSQILNELKSISGLNPEWIEAVRAFLDTVGADVQIANITERERGPVSAWCYEEKKTPQIPPVRKST
jgi:hypothetical protein